MRKDSLMKLIVCVVAIIGIFVAFVNSLASDVAIVARGCVCEDLLCEF